MASHRTSCFWIAMFSPRFSCARTWLQYILPIAIQNKHRARKVRIVTRCLSRGSEPWATMSAATGVLTPRPFYPRFGLQSAKRLFLCRLLNYHWDLFSSVAIRHNALVRLRINIGATSQAVFGKRASTLVHLCWALPLDAARLHGLIMHRNRINRRIPLNSKSNGELLQVLTELISDDWMQILQDWPQICASGSGDGADLQQHGMHMRQLVKNMSDVSYAANGHRCRGFVCGQGRAVSRYSGIKAHHYGATRRGTTIIEASFPAKELKLAGRHALSVAASDRVKRSANLTFVTAVWVIPCS